MNYGNVPQKKWTKSITGNVVVVVTVVHFHKVDARKSNPYIQKKTRSIE